MITIYPTQVRYDKQAETVVTRAAFFMSCLGGTEKAQAQAASIALTCFYRTGNWVAAVLHGVRSARAISLREINKRPPEPLDDEHQCNDPLPHCGVRS